MTTDKAIEINDLHKTFRGGLFGGRNIDALRGVSLEVERGSIFGLLGPNGAGKTTLIKILLGIVRKTSGSAAMLGMPAGSRSSRRHVGFLPENHRIPRHLTGNTALEYYGGLSYLSRREVKQKTPALLEKVGLEDWGSTLVRNYSKGMMQRLGLAQAMIHEPDLLILDEPTDGVDPVGRMEMRTILQGLKEQGNTIFVNSHLLQEIELVCDRVAILAQGQVRRIGTIDEITRVDSDMISLTVAASEVELGKAIEGISTEKIVVLSPQTVELRIRASEQGKLDKCIDQLREQRISILEISRPRGTLERAFLDIIQRLDDEQSEPEDGPGHPTPQANLNSDQETPA